jgi:tRNA 2-thiouridine synthesizing protein A
VKQLDVRGEICPYPMLRAVEALKRLPAGEGLEVVTDHPPALSTIPWEAAKLGFEATLSEAGQAEWKVTLQPGAGAKRRPNEVLADLNRQLASLALPE